MKGKYNNYSSEIKRQIMESGNPNLFPELNIPRSTARYWIERAKPIITEKKKDISLIDRINKLEQELLRERRKIEFIKVHMKVFAKIVEPKVRKKYKTSIVKNVESYRSKLGINECIKLIDLPRTTYERWRIKNYKCKNSRSKFCTKTKGNQLTFNEVKTMEKMLGSKKFAHLSIRSLQYYCLRENILNCSLDSWYRYRALFDMKRPYNHKKYPRKYRIGIRANKVNEIWHIDATQVRLDDGTKAYLQTIVDNKSRFIVGWNIDRSINSNNTFKVIENAISSSSKPGTLMMDGGTENTNKLVGKVLVHKNIKRLISRLDTHWSNSMIECVFRSLKNNYLYNQKCKTLRDLERKVSFYFKEYNSKIPHSSLGGAVPSEVYLGNWSLDIEVNLKARIQEGLRKRILFNKGLTCCTEIQ